MKLMVKHNFMNMNMRTNYDTLKFEISIWIFVEKVFKFLKAFIIYTYKKKAFYRMKYRSN